jgi:RNA recognition motif-containing protein
MNIYVGNLSYDATEDDLRQAFAALGQVDSVRVITDKFSGKSKGFGFVEMPNNNEANAAIAAINGKMLRGREVRVNEARPKDDRPMGGGGGGGFNRSRPGGSGGGGGRSSGPRW